MDARQSSFLHSLSQELGGSLDLPASVREILGACSRNDHGIPTRAIRWPEGLRQETASRWVEEARQLLRIDAWPDLDGRILLVALALADPVAGREIVRSGLFEALAAQLPARLVEQLTPLGVERLEAIPLLAAAAGVANGVVKVPGRVWDLAFSPNGRQILVGTDRGWTLLRRSNRVEIQSAETPSPVVRVGFSLDGRELIVGHGDRFEYHPLNGSEIRLVGADDEPLRISRGIAIGRGYAYVDDRDPLTSRPRADAAIASEARVFAVAGDEGRVRVWDASHGSSLGEINERGPLAIALSADGHTLITRNDERVALWDVASGRQEWSLAVDGRAAVAISPDDTRIAAAGRRGVLLAAATGNVVEELADGVTHLAFSADGTRLAMACADGSVWISNPDTGAAIAHMTVTSPVTALAYTDDGEQLVAGTEGGELVAWYADFAPARRRRLVDYSADDTSAASDLTRRLDIDPDVDALATLVAARAVEPPLSIGLFGDWGSGKTFFMRRLQARVAELATDARDSGELQKDVPWHKRIVQIEFNAWHYAEGNLWASLVEHIFGNLRISDDEDADLVEKRRRDVERQITQQRAVTDTARNEAAEALLELTRERDALQRQLDALEARDPLAQVADAGLRQSVVAVARQVLTPHDEAAAKTYAELGETLFETRAVLTRGSAVLTPLLRGPRPVLRLLALLSVLALSSAVAWVVSWFAPAAAESLAGVATLVTGAVAWVRRQAAWTRDRLDELDRAASELAAPARELQAAREAKITHLQREHDDAAEKARAETLRLAVLEDQLKVTTPSRMLERLIADRAESDDYRRQLGTVAQVRRDFDEMSKFLCFGHDEIEHFDTLEQEKPDGDVRVGRIVLYIDDLDRCEPKQVVAVLQAVHLLLAFPLFTVVVGVDMRWVERALCVHHDELLDSGGAAPRDYLEKIFQIPFWLEPLTADASRSMLRGILGVTTAPTQRDAVLPAPPPLPPIVFSQTGRGIVPAAAVPLRSDASSGGPRRPAVPRPAAASRDLEPERLEIGEDELAAMDALAPLLGRSPRALKRFINTYRLLKVRADDLDTFLRDDYRAALFLLALATGVPLTAAPFLDAILDGEDGTVGSRLGGDKQVSAWLAEEAATPWRDLTLATLRPQAEEVVRFTFHWHGSETSEPSKLR